PLGRSRRLTSKLPAYRRVPQLPPHPRITAARLPGTFRSNTNATQRAASQPTRQKHFQDQADSPHPPTKWHELFQVSWRAGMVESTPTRPPALRPFPTRRSPDLPARSIAPPHKQTACLRRGRQLPPSTQKRGNALTGHFPDQHE